MSVSSEGESEASFPVLVAPDGSVTVTVSPSLAIKRS